MKISAKITTIIGAAAVFAMLVVPAMANTTTHESFLAGNGPGEGTIHILLLARGGNGNGGGGKVRVVGVETVVAVVPVTRIVTGMDPV